MTLRNPLLRLSILILFSASLLFCQSSTGSLTGSVLDPNGAVIPDVKVVARNDGTGVEYTSTTTSTGVYLFPALPVGPYTAIVEHTGFKKLSRTGIVISIANRSALDLTLQVGNVQQSVEVTGEAPLLNAATSEIGTNFAPKLMKDAPLFVSGGFRNPENFIAYMPGVNGGAGDSSINGGNRRSKEIMIDGASHTNPESGGVSFANNGGLGSVEMFGEFKLLTSNFSAEYGRSGGGIEIFVTKSGTNQFHGSVFDFVRNDKFDAAGWAVNQRNPYLGKAKVRQNEYGVAAGGPVLIPKLYDGKNRTFWFFTYNGYRQSNSGGPGTATVGTSLMKKGDFSELGSKLIYDPNTTEIVNGAAVRTPFAGNKIPTSRFSSVSSKILPLIPDATRNSISSNYDTTSLGAVDKGIYSIKGDHAFSDRNRISGTFSWQRLTSWSYGGLPGALASGLETSDKPDTTRINHDYLFRPNVINHVTFGLTRYQNYWNQLPAHREDWPTKLGLKGVATGDSSSFPVVTFSDGITGFGNNPKTRGAQENWTYQLTNTLSWMRGRHELKFGFEYRRPRTFQVPMDESGMQGIFSFSNYQTAGSVATRGNTGYGFASFLLGNTNSAQRYYYTKGVDIIYPYYGGFVQDNFKVSSRLTLNLGLRWEIYVPRTDQNQTQSSFDPTVPNPGAGGLLGAITFYGTDPGHNGRVRPGNVYLNNFGPRLGFAYQLMPKTVIRGGYGMYFSAANGNTGGGCFPCGWGTSASPTVTSDGFSAASNWDGGFNPGAGFVAPPVFDPSYANRNTVLVLSKEDGLAGRIQNWSLNVQRELPKGFLVDLAYVGSHGSRLTNYVSMNQVNPKYLSLGSLLSRRITDPDVVAAGFKEPYPGFASSWGTAGTLAQALRPYPQFGSIVHTYMGQGETSYHSFQGKFEKRFGSVNLMAAYTWSKTMSIRGAYTQAGNGVAPQDAYNLAPEKWLSPDDYPKVLNLIYSYELPFGKGKKFLRTAPGVVKTAVSGWSVSAVQVYRSGSLIQIIPSNTLGSGVLFTSGLRYNLTGKPIRTSAGLTDLDPANPNVRWLNRDAFSVPAPYTFGTASAFNNDLRNPMGRSENLSIIKRTPVYESINIELRADLSNLLNRTTFGGINGNLTDANFGRPTAVGTGPRIIQFGLKVNF